MPTIDNEARRREFNRTLALSRKRGDFITCDCPPVDLKKLEAEAAAKAEEKARWDFSLKYGLY